VNPFVIHCTTCQARLKVTDESAIGGIYACPKCGSMVQVLPPTAAQTPAPAAPGAARSPAKAKTAKPQTLKLQVARPLTEGAAKVTTPPPLPSRKSTAEAASSVVAAAALPLAGAASTSKITLATNAALKYVRQEPWLFGGALAAGIGIGTVIWLAVASGGAAKAGPEQPAAVQTSAVAAPAENLEQAATRSQPSDKSQTAAGDSNVPQRPQPEPQAGTADNSPENSADDSVRDAPGAKPADVSEPDAGAQQAARDAEPAAAAGADEVAGAADPANQAEAPAPESAEESTLRHAGPQSSRQLEIESRLSGRVQSVEFRKVPLSQFVLFISALIAAPVELDLPALKAAGKGPESFVSVNLEKTTAGEALKAALESHGLVYAVRGDRVVVTTK